MLGVWKRPHVPQSLYTSGFKACRVRLLDLFEKYSFFAPPRGKFCAPVKKIFFPNYVEKLLPPKGKFCSP